MTTALPQPNAVVDAGYVPVVSLAGMDDPRQRNEIAREVGEALRRSGFYVVVDHDVPRALFDGVCQAALTFFHQPEAAKRALSPVAGDRAWRGWTSRFRASARLVGGDDVDLDEAWAMNAYDEALGWRVLRSLEPRLRAAFVHPNLFPAVPGFRRSVLAYFAAMEGQLLRLLALHAIDLDIPPDSFAALLAGGLTNLVVNYYAPVPRSSQSHGCLGPHTDLGVLTGLMHSGQRGLQVVDRAHPDRWVEMPDQPDGIVINAGDLLELISGGRYRSALHRVVCPVAQERLSVPVFVQPSPQAVIAPACPPPAGKPGSEPVRFAEYFAQRLGLMYDVEEGLG
jgi:isopenicillin N synthase-like dioxygenase